MRRRAFEYLAAQQGGMTHAQIGERFGVTRSAVTKALGRRFGPSIVPEYAKSYDPSVLDNRSDDQIVGGT